MAFRKSESGFTLIELLVVVAMIMLLAGALTSAIAGAAKRAKIQACITEAQNMTNAILAYENYTKNHEIKEMNDQMATKSSLPFIVGDGKNELNGEHARALVANGCIAVSEGANMPSTPEAVETFQEAKILYAPGKASNAGGVSVSGLEMSQNSMKYSWTAEEVDARLHEIMKSIHASCVKYGTMPNGHVNYVKGANVAGFMKVAKAMMEQGAI